MTWTQSRFRVRVSLSLAGPCDSRYKQHMPRHWPPRRRETTAYRPQLMGGGEWRGMCCLYLESQVKHILVSIPICWNLGQFYNTISSGGHVCLEIQRLPFDYQPLSRW